MAIIPLSKDTDIIQGGSTPISIPSTTQPDPEFGFRSVDVITTPDSGIVVTGPQGPEGPPGEDGPRGRGIEIVERTSGDGSAGTVDTYTMYYSQEAYGIDGGAVSLDTTNFNNNLDNTITDTQKLADAVDELTTGGGGDATLDSDLTPTVTLGGVSPSDTFTTGTDWEVIVRKMLEQYVQPKMNSITLSSTPSASIFEVGQSVNINSVTISTTNDSDGNPPQNMYVTGPGFNKSVTTGVNNADASTVVTKTTNTSESWTLTGEDKNAVSLPSRSTNKNWYFRHFVGGNSTELTSGSSDAAVQTVIDALQITSLRSGRSASITTGSWSNTAGNYTYITYAAKFGDLSNILQNGALPVLGAFTKLGDFNFTNAQGHIESYRVYKSNSDAAFADGTSLTIS